MAGRELTFELVGLNNQNFIMKDHQTGSWWQQVTGEAILGPLAGERLRAIPSEISTFALWSEEHPDARVLAFDDDYAEHYFERIVPQERTEETMIPFHTEEDPDSPLDRGSLIAGIQTGEVDKAYPMAALLQQRVILDRVAGSDLLIVLGTDNETVRAFDRVVDGAALEFYLDATAKDGSTDGDVETEAPIRLIDASTGSEWTFAGVAVSGEYLGTRLERVPVLTEYWFDWKYFHPETRLYTAGLN